MGTKTVIRRVLHDCGGLTALRLLRRNQFRVLMFHHFPRSSSSFVASLCEYLCRTYEPVSMGRVAEALNGNGQLPANAVAVTVDDGFADFLHVHPIFARNRIPVTIYVVAGFADRRIWLWPDQIGFGIRNSQKQTLTLSLDPVGPLELDLSTAKGREQSIGRLCEALKVVPNQRRLEFLSRWSMVAGVDIPAAPPADQAPLSWDELRALGSDGVEIGCHTDNHPILSRVTDPLELDHEIRGAKQIIENRMGTPVRHFCYPNGREIDISPEAIDRTRAAGFESAVTCTFGLNTTAVNPFRIQRVPFDHDLPFQYATELLAGLHT